MKIIERQLQILLKTTIVLLGVLWAGVVAQSASRAPVRAQHGMVAATEIHASRAGLEVLRQGGNAVDAAIATAFALAVTYPAAGNLGGGGFMMVRLSDGRTTALDYREVAPLNATRTMYLDEQGNLRQGEGSSLVGYRAAGVPGTVAGMEYAFGNFGSQKVSWAQLIEPARRLAEDGFPVSHRLAQSLRQNAPLLERYPDSRRIFLRDGDHFREGELLRQPELAATLRLLQQNGAREFYEGETARRLAADMAANNGLITLDDLRAYVPKEREPLRGTYRGHQIVTMPPPSSGGAVLLQMLNILEGYDLDTMGHASSEKYHLIIEAMRRAFADRAEYFGDPDFVAVPLSKLLDKNYAAQRRATINLQRASSSQEIGAGLPPAPETEETTHFTIVDAAGNAVSNTYTLNGAYGSGVVARGTGVLLNNEMDDFTSKPGAPNLFGLIQNERNAIAPRKRPLSSMTPTFVLRRDNSLWFALGSPGGPTIINTVLQIILNVVDEKMNIQQAVDVPRVHHQWQPDEVTWEPFGLSADTAHALAARGHKLTERPRFMGDAQAIFIEEETNIRLGTSDPRGDGVPVGY